MCCQWGCQLVPVVTALKAPGALFNLPGVSVLLWLLCHPCAWKGQASLCPWFQVMLLCCLWWCSFPVSTSSLSSCFVAHSCKPRLMESVPSTADEETSAPLVLYHLLFSPSHRRPIREHQHTSACTQMFVFKAGFVRGLLEQAEKRSFLMGKLGDLMKAQEGIPSEYLMFQQSHGDCVCGHKRCCISHC